MRRSTWKAARLVPLLGMSAWGCAETAPPGTLAVRDTLPDGRPRVSYAVLPVPVDTVKVEVRIGSADGEGADVFGNVRAIEVDSSGTIYVLDYQASEIRAFRPDGAHLATLTRKGEGPGELSEANGMAFGPDGTLWVNDHGNRSVIGISREGREVARHRQLVPGYGYTWAGLVDDRGVFWEAWSHTDRDRDIDLEATGIVEGTGRRYYKSFDPRTGAYDSVFVGAATFRSYRAAVPERSRWSTGPGASGRPPRRRSWSTASTRGETPSSRSRWTRPRRRSRTGTARSGRRGWPASSSAPRRSARSWRG
jgi:hypothetical protein